MTYHEPVMLKESTEALNISPGGTYVDVTYGGGGHSKEILRNLDSGKLYAFDQDQDSRENIIEESNFVLIQQNFRYLLNFLKMYNTIPVDGVLADLGISSHQIDTESRGFAFRSDGPLDMRMNQSAEKTAADILNTYKEEDLSKILWEYGELKNSRRIAREICVIRESEKLESTQQFVELIKHLAPKNQHNKFFAKVFQALRIEVNGEMEVLKEMLLQCKDVIREGGRLSVITYHSLEDRLVKNFIRSGNFEGKLNKDFYGNVIKPFDAINRKPIIPSDEEIDKNNRARSAKLRIAERNNSE